MIALENGNHMDMVTILHDYGWAAVFVVVAVDKMFPFFASKMFPQLQRNAQAKIDAEKEEREFRHQMELRQADAFDKLVTTCQGIENFMGSVDNRLDTIEGKLNIPSRRHKRTPRS